MDKYNDKLNELFKKNKVFSEDLNYEINDEIVPNSKYDLHQVNVKYGNNNPIRLSPLVFQIQDKENEKSLAFVNGIELRNVNDSNISFSIIGSSDKFRGKIVIPNDNLFFKNIPKAWYDKYYQNQYEECNKYIQNEPVSLDEEISQKFVGREDCLRDIREFIYSFDKKVCLIESDLGTGKTWTMRKSFLNLNEYPGTSYYSYYYISKVESTLFNANDILKSLAAKIIKDSSIPDNLINQNNLSILYKKIFEEIELKNSSDPKQIILFIDGVDELIDSSVIDLVKWIHKISDDTNGKIKFIISTRENEIVNRYLNPSIKLDSSFFKNEKEISLLVLDILGHKDWILGDVLEEYQNAIIKKTKGNILYADRIIQSILDKKIETVDSIYELPESFFKFLEDDLEVKVLDPLINSGNTKDAKDILITLGILYIYKRKISLDHISHLLNRSFNDIELFIIPNIKDYIIISSNEEGKLKEDSKIYFKVAGYFEFIESYDKVRGYLSEIMTRLFDINVILELSEKDLISFVYRLDYLINLNNLNSSYNINDHMLILIKNHKFVEKYIKIKHNKFEPFDEMDFMFIRNK